MIKLQYLSHRCPWVSKCLKPSGSEVQGKALLASKEIGMLSEGDNYADLL